MEGNQQKMRYALETILNLAWVVKDENSDCGPKTKVPEQFIIDVARSALSAPPRNCDVGTALEQAERMRLYCNSHGEDESGCFRCDKCPFLTVERCELAWAQMPYDAQEGGEK